MPVNTLINVNTVINKVTWQQVGHVAEPGRYMFRFGWLTIAPDDLAIWTQFPDATFTLVRIPSPPLAAETGEPIAETEFHLGAFDLHVRTDPDWRGMQPTYDTSAKAQSSV